MSFITSRAEVLYERRRPDSRFKLYLAELSQIRLPEMANLADFTEDEVSFCFSFAF